MCITFALLFYLSRNATWLRGLHKRFMWLWKGYLSHTGELGMMEMVQSGLMKSLGSSWYTILLTLSSGLPWVPWNLSAQGWVISQRQGDKFVATCCTHQSLQGSWRLEGQIGLLFLILPGWLSGIPGWRMTLGWGKGQQPRAGCLMLKESQ